VLNSLADYTQPPLDLEVSLSPSPEYATRLRNWFLGVVGSAAGLEAETILRRVNEFHCGPPCAASRSGSRRTRQPGRRATATSAPGLTTFRWPLLTSPSRLRRNGRAGSPVWSSKIQALTSLSRAVPGCIYRWFGGPSGAVMRPETGPRVQLSCSGALFGCIYAA